ncbi:MAG: hypothetical protein ACNA8W_21715 [Bradymonadaceae bacterium]
MFSLQCGSGMAREEFPKPGDLNPQHLRQALIEPNPGVFRRLPEPDDVELPLTLVGPDVVDEKGRSSEEASDANVGV